MSKPRKQNRRRQNRNKSRGRPLEAHGLFLCHKTQKRQYTRRQADQAIERAAANTGRVPKRAYECPHCDSWHLTSLDHNTASIRTTPWHRALHHGDSQTLTAPERRAVDRVMRRDRALRGARIESGSIHLAFTTGTNPAISALDVFDNLKAIPDTTVTRFTVSVWPRDTPHHLLADAGFYTPDSINAPAA